MALTKEAWRRRVAAACALRGLDLNEMPDLPGLPKRAAIRAGHPSDTYQPNHALALSLAESLELPVEWFEQEEDPLNGATPSEQLSRLGERLEVLAAERAAEQAALKAQLDAVQNGQAELLGAVSSLRDEVERLRQRRERDERGRASSRN